MLKSILIKNNLINLPSGKNTPSRQVLGTILANITYYGYTFSKEAYQLLSTASDEDLSSWWQNIEPTFKELTGDNRNMDDFVVYKNFPQEVLEMSQAEYWFKQILMYIGFPNEYFTEEPVERDPLLENVTLKVLRPANDASLGVILDSLLKSPARWTDDQQLDVLFLASEGLDVDLSLIPFKENMVNTAAFLMNEDIEVKLRSATDVLRLAIALSDGDITMAVPTKFRRWSKKERRFFLGLLENTSNLEEDIARRKNVFKKLIKPFHPNQYKTRFPKVCVAYDKLYKGKGLTTFNSKVELGLASKDDSVLDLLSQRPGEFMRRLRLAIEKFGLGAAMKFVPVIGKLKTIQLLKISKYLQTVNDRKTRTIAPRGNWTKLQILENDKKIPAGVINFLVGKIEAEIKSRVEASIGSVNVSEATKMIKLQTNDSELSPYGRGTEFPIPKEMTFIRTASYWKKHGYGNTWFDNGWNFFDENWGDKGVCCWTDTSVLNKSAIFSGDPTNSKDLEGRACQMIDLYIDKLIENGVRYAVWNILCYSNIPFSQAEDVYASLQWGEKPQTGKLFEPSRCQLNFPIKGENYTKYIAYIDLVERKLIYMDANLRGSTQSARNNQKTLLETMPAFVEYLNSLPTVHDLFKDVSNESSEEVTPINIVYNDDQVSLEKGEKAYVFKPINESNDFEQLDINSLLG